MRSSVEFPPILGGPAPFSTAAKAAWKSAIHVALSGIAPVESSYARLAFTVSATKLYPVGPDLDNLCHPVFGVLCQLGSFGGRRPT